MLIKNLAGRTRKLAHSHEVLRKKTVGIVSYGVALPKFKVSGETIAEAQGKTQQKIYKALGVISKSVPGKDEDTITLSTASGLQAIERLQALFDQQEDTDARKTQKSQAQTSQKNSVRSKIESIYIGSESHPYAVKPSGTVVAQALGIASDSCTGATKPLATSDLQFACKAGTQSLQISSLYTAAGFGESSLAIGTDTAQSRPGDVLEYTAGAGSAAFIVGSEKKNLLLARLIATTSIATDTPDFWRRPNQSYPEHAGRFTGEPGYFSHITMAANQILQETGLQPRDFQFCVFHSPNAKFPIAVAQKLGFSKEQLKPTLVVEQIGNLYAGSSMVGLASALDQASANQKILVVSYGSGAGSDAFVFETTDHLVSTRNFWKEKTQPMISETVQEQIEQLEFISYQKYRENSSH